MLIRKSLKKSENSPLRFGANALGQQAGIWFQLMPLPKSSLLSDLLTAILRFTFSSKFSTENFSK